MEFTKTLLVTGGAGFIGSHVVRLFVNKYPDTQIVNLDKLTYAGNPQNMIDYENDERYIFVEGDICNKELIKELLMVHQPNTLVNFAAESHVDRSIDGPSDFIDTNIHGSFILLQESLRYFNGLEDKSKFLFHHVSTDEVFGSLGEDGIFTEETSYDPSSPYSASKAASENIAQAFLTTYNLKICILRISNNSLVLDSVNSISKKSRVLFSQEDISASLGIKS